MKLTQETGSGNLIRSYQHRQIRINDATYTRSVIVTADQLVTDWAPQTLAELTEQHLQPILDLQPEVVILGTGATQQFPQRAILQRVLRAGIGIEVMATDAACRTYNILMAEDRRVAAALFP
ncbi:MAG: Xcc1710-like domain-containing protein [Xanthomonadaceae bacterium]|nr:Xcc1710-like domain-containing protein [Xanthomonadaceae bacterium]